MEREWIAIGSTINSFKFEVERRKSVKFKLRIDLQSIIDVKKGIYIFKELESRDGQATNFSLHHWKTWKGRRKWLLRQITRASKWGTWLVVKIQLAQKTEAHELWIIGQQITDSNKTIQDIWSDDKYFSKILLLSTRQNKKSRIKLLYMGKVYDERQQMSTIFSWGKISISKVNERLKKETQATTNSLKLQNLHTTSNWNVILLCWRVIA